MTDLQYTQKLIEIYLPIDEISDEGSSERYQRGKTPHTIFTWWARRPFAAMKSVVEASLMFVQHTDKPTSNGTNERNKSKRVLDLFAGGATIPIEIASSNAHAFSLDNNELAHFIQLALLKLSQSENELSNLVEKHGENILLRLKKETTSYFPAREFESESTIAYLWSRSINCPKCNAELSLQKRPWLSKKKNRNIFIDRYPDIAQRKFSKSIAYEGSPTKNASAWVGNIIVCPFCSKSIERSEIDDVLSKFGYDELTAFCTTLGRGKDFHIADTTKTALVPSDSYLHRQIQDDLIVLESELPLVELPRWSGFTNPTLYGIHHISDLFNLRQLAVMIRLCRLLKEEYDDCVELYGQNTAKAIVAFLSALIDQLADWNGRICMWISQNEQVGRGYSGPGIPMMWDFVETDPLEHGPANLWDKLKRITAGIESIPRFAKMPDVQIGDARNLPYPDDFFDAIVTDPPYFDNLYYNVLADCIYVWKRLALKLIFPEIFQSALTNQNRELSVCKYRHKNYDDASKFYTEGMTQALAESSRVLKSDGVISLVFAHSSFDGWISIIKAFQDAKLDLVAAWNMEIERKHRPRGVKSNATNTSFVLVGKKRLLDLADTKWKDLERNLVERLQKDKEARIELGEVQSSLAMSLFGLAVCLCQQAGHVYDNGQELSMFEVLTRAIEIIQSHDVELSLVKR